MRWDTVESIATVSCSSTVVYVLLCFWGMEGVIPLTFLFERRPEVLER
jgi:hypothetical protein